MGFQTINARLTVMEGKVKFVEGHQSSHSSSLQQRESSSNSGQHSTTPPKYGAASSAPPRLRSVTPSTENGDAHDAQSFSKSTIGSISLPISLTPGPMMHNNHQRKAALSKTQPRSAGGFMNRMNIIQPMTHAQQQNNNNNRQYISTNTQRPKHIHAPIARSPFIGSLGASLSSSMYIGGRNMGNASMYNPSMNQSYPTMSNSSSSGMYGGNPHVDIMRYPISSSDANSLNKSSPIPHIQSVAPPSSSNDQSSSDNPDSTLNFINELKEMLKSTDRLLKNKPMSLYESGAHV